MVEDRGGMVPDQACVPADPAPYAAGRDAHARFVQVSVSGTRAVLVGDGSTQVNVFGEDPGAGPAAGAAGQMLREVTDPFALEVHRPVQADDPSPDLPELPAYIPRDHDRLLGEVVRAAAGGVSGIAVLVGGSSTGKTRACWEALGLLRDQEQPWRLWHPIDPGRPEAALRELPAIGPRTVVWLNEAQLYLRTGDGTGEQVAAGLREMLRDPRRSPVLVLATLWPEYWNELVLPPAAGKSDQHAQARELMSGPAFPVPPVLDGAALAEAATSGDPRLASAAAGADGGRVIQFLAGVPELIRRYDNAALAVRALLDAAVDARRLGMRLSLSRAFLETATPGYLTGHGPLSGTLLDRALQDAATPAKGIPGPLTPAGPGLGAAAGSVYRLADCLEQHGRRTRRACFPPQTFWAAAAAHASPGDLPALIEAAAGLGQLRGAARLRKSAARHGDVYAAADLVRDLHALYPADPRPARWAAASVPLKAPDTVPDLHGALREAAQDRLATALAARAAASVSLDNPVAVARLLRHLYLSDEDGQVTALAARAAASVSLEDPEAVRFLLFVLEEVREDGLAAALATRAAASVPLDNPQAVANLLNGLPRRPAAALAARVAADLPASVPLDNPGAVAERLDALREAGKRKHITELADGAATSVSLDNPEAVGRLLRALHWAGKRKQITTLADRIATGIPLDDPHAAAELLTTLCWTTRKRRQITALATRIALGVPLNDPEVIAALLRAQQQVHGDEQVTALLARAAGSVSLNDPLAAARVLDSLWNGGMRTQVNALAARAAASVPLDNPEAVAELLRVLHYTGEDGHIAELAARVPLNDPEAVVSLLNALQRVGADEQVAVLAARAAASTPVNSPPRVVDLLNALQRVGADEQVAVLAARAAASTPVNDPYDDVDLLNALHRMGADDQVAALAARAAASVRLDDPHYVARLLDALREAGADEQVAVLAARAAAGPLDNFYAPNTGRAPYSVVSLLDALREAGADQQRRTVLSRLRAEGYLYLFREEAGHEKQYRFGRESDGSPAPQWGWTDLE